MGSKLDKQLSEKAKVVYRKLWMEFRECLEDDRRKQLQKAMDKLQPFIANRASDKVWRDFAASLPGYLDFWFSFQDIMLANLREKRFRSEV